MGEMEARARKEWDDRVAKAKVVLEEATSKLRAEREREDNAARELQDARQRVPYLSQQTYLASVKVDEETRTRDKMVLDARRQDEEHAEQLRRTTASVAAYNDYVRHPRRY